MNQGWWSVMGAMRSAALPVCGGRHQATVRGVSVALARTVENMHCPVDAPDEETEGDHSFAAS